MSNLSPVSPEEISAEAVARLSSKEFQERALETMRPLTPEMYHSMLASGLGPSAPWLPGSKVFLRPLPTSPTGARPSTSTISRLEKLPTEIRLQVFELLDIPSLFKLAASNSRMRHLVVSMPETRAAKFHSATILAVTVMLRAGTAKHFSLQHFAYTVSSPTCTVCKDASVFAPFICLLQCRRVCFNCIRFGIDTSRMSRKMARQCLGLTGDELTGRGTGEAVLQRRVRQADLERGDRLPGDARWVLRSSKMGVVTIMTALAVAEKKYAAVGGRKHVTRLVKRYLEGHPHRIQSAPLVSGDEFSVLCQIIRQEWDGQMPNNDWVLMARVPHLDITVRPWRLEQGVSCEGCARGVKGFRASPGYMDSVKTAGNAYLMSQFSAHLRGCESAQSILRGTHLNMMRTLQLRNLMTSSADSFNMAIGFRRPELMVIVNGVDLFVGVRELRASVTKALEEIQKTGNRLLQERTRAEWKAASPRTDTTVMPASTAPAPKTTSTTSAVGANSTTTGKH